MRLTHKVILTDDGYRVGVTEVGEGVALVFLHGLSVSSWAYKELFFELAEMGFRVIGLDAPNHGSSGSLPWGHTVSDMMHITAKALDRIGVSYAIMAGHSMGGGMVVEFAARYPERVIAAVLLDAAAGEEHHAGIRLGKVHQFAPRALRYFGGAFVDLAGDTRLAFSRRDHRERVRFLKLLASSRSGLRCVRAAWALMRANTLAALELMKDQGTPTAIIHGEHDKIVPLCAAQSAAKLADADLYVVPDVFHSWMLADPQMGADMMLRAIVTLLDRSAWE